MLAADRGRLRAKTLFAVLGAGPDRVEQHLSDLDKALGSHSPGIAGLAGLVSETRAAGSPQAPTVGRQHVVSQAILRNFCEPDEGRAGLQLIRRP